MICLAASRMWDNLRPRLDFLSPAYFVNGQSTCSTACPRRQLPVDAAKPGLFLKAFFRGNFSNCSWFGQAVPLMFCRMDGGFSVCLSLLVSLAAKWHAG